MNAPKSLLWRVEVILKSGVKQKHTVQGTGEELGRIRDLCHTCWKGEGQGYIKLGLQSIRVEDISALTIVPKKGLLG